MVGRLPIFEIFLVLFLFLFLYKSEEENEEEEEDPPAQIKSSVLDF